jgi:transposase-like protein
MPAPRKFDEETRARAVRLYQDRLRDHGESKLTARKHVGALLDINPATLRNWIEPNCGRSARQARARPIPGSPRRSCGGYAPRTPSCGGRTRS